MNLYKWQDASGRTIYSDRMPEASAQTGTISNIRNGRTTEVSSDQGGRDPKEAKGLIKAAAKHIPKGQIYLNYIEYLRRGDQSKALAVMKELLKNDPKTYIKLTQAGVFKPISSTKSIADNVEAAVVFSGELLAGKAPTGAIGKVAEKHLTEWMKRDNFLPKSAPEILPPKVSVTQVQKLDSWVGAENARRASALARAASPMGKAVSTSAQRVLGPVVDIGLGMLDTQVAAGFSATIGKAALITRLRKHGIELTTDEDRDLRSSMARADWKEVRSIVGEAAARNGLNVK